jgi:hypothetical protein
MVNSDELAGATGYLSHRRGVVQTDAVITGLDCICRILVGKYEGRCGGRILLK